MRYEINKKRPHETPLMMFLFHIRRGSAYERGHNFFHLGRLYRGYVGLMVNVKNIGCLDIWFYNMEKG